MSRLSKIFSANKKCFIPFVTAGHPDLGKTEEIILALAESGAHIVEIGIPFSDPIADGPVIQKSTFAALEHGYTVGDYIEMVRRLRAKTSVGLIFMTYMNPVLSYGLKRLDEEASAAGLDGILISDLTPEEYNRLQPLKQLDTVFLAAPTSSDKRLDSICAAGRGFIYLIARTGVTGGHSDIGENLQSIVERIRKRTQLPIAVGFGVSSADDVRRVWHLADGAIVGTALVEFIEEHKEEENLAEQVRDFVETQLMPQDR